MPRRMLEVAATDAYRRIAFEIGFGNREQFESLFVTQLAALFEIPRSDAEKRIDRYVGDLRGRLMRSVARCDASLLPLRAMPLFEDVEDDSDIGIEHGPTLL